jgi:L,D-transpeptidase ErfK/SrfK
MNQRCIFRSVDATMTTLFSKTILRAPMLAVLLCAAPLAALRAEIYLLPPGGGDLVGAMGTAQAAYEDTLTDIARRTGLGYEEIIRANPKVDVWLPGEGTEVLLPTRYVVPGGTREGILVNIAEYRLYYFTRVGGQPAVATFPISIGRMDWDTPIGRHAILSKQKNPTWYPPESIRKEHADDGRYLAKMVPPGPDNPLGEYAMRLSNAGYLIHGTNRPVGVGMRVTHGCIRMYPEDIEWLFPQVAVRTPVQIVNQPYKFGWAADGFYLEVHPVLEEKAGAEDRGMTEIMQQYVRATDGRPAEVDWALVEQVYREKLGFPIRVGRAVTMADDGAERVKSSAVPGQTVSDSGRRKYR